MGGGDYRRGRQAVGGEGKRGTEEMEKGRGRRRGEGRESEEIKRLKKFG